MTSTLADGKGQRIAVPLRLSSSNKVQTTAISEQNLAELLNAVSGCTASTAVVMLLQLACFEACA